MKIKICGMKFEENIISVAGLKPDYMGFIFYEKSKRHFEGSIPQIDKKIKKVGVFVNASLEYINEKIAAHKLDAVQLHGDESVEYCTNLKSKEIRPVEIIKAFSISEAFDFESLKPYEQVCDLFLFDTKGKERGGNGVLFDWELLRQYKLRKPFFLSGGIGPDETGQVLSFLKSDQSEFCYGLDVNSRFEVEPGLKKLSELKNFIELTIKA